MSYEANKGSFTDLVKIKECCFPMRVMVCGVFFLTRRLLPHGGWDFMANELAGPFSVTTSISGNIIQSAFELIPVRLAS